MTVLRQISIFCQKIMFLEFWQKLCQKFEQFRTETFWRTCSTSWTWPLNLNLTLFDSFWLFLTLFGQTVLEIFKFEELRNMNIKQVDKHYNVINNSCSWIINEIFVENAY